MSHVYVGTPNAHGLLWIGNQQIAYPRQKRSQLVSAWKVVTREVGGGPEMEAGIHCGNSEK